MTANAQPDSYFPTLADDSNVACEQSWCDFHDVKSTPNSVPHSATFPLNQEYKDVSSSSMDSVHHNSSNCHADLAKITEYEKWDNPAPETAEFQKAPTEQYDSYSSTPSPQLDFPVPFRGTSRALSDPHGSKLLGRSQPSGFSEGQSHPKRRQSWDAHRMPDPRVQLEENIDVVKFKQPSKNAHSVIERRYRENLNTKITQLDQELISACNLKSLSSGEKPEEAISKTRKADVLTDAIKYVKQSERESKAHTQEISFLRLRVAALEKLVSCGDCTALKQYTGLQLGQSLNL